MQKLGTLCQLGDLFYFILINITYCLLRCVYKQIWLKAKYVATKIIKSGISSTAGEKLFPDHRKCAIQCLKDFFIRNKSSN